MDLRRAKKKKPLYVTVFFQKKPMLNMDEYMAKKRGEDKITARVSDFLSVW